MNAALQSLDSLLGDALNTPVVVVKHPNLWKVDDCLSIAINLLDHIGKVPSDFLPEKPKNLRSEPFKEFIVAPGKSLDKKLPCIQFLVTEEEVENVEHGICTLSVPALQEFITNLDTEYKYNHDEKASKLSALLHVFVQGVATHRGVHHSEI